MIKKCCCIGILSLIPCVLAWVILIPFLSGDDVKNFNPAQEVVNDFFVKIEDHLIESKDILTEKDGKVSRFIKCENIYYILYWARLCEKNGQNNQWF